MVGWSLDDLAADLGAFWRALASDSQLRWLGPEKGVIHLALAAIVNAVWDLYAKAGGKPVWKLLADMTPREIVRCIDFRYITDALTPDEAIDLLERQRSTKADRERRCCSRRVSGLHDVGRLDWLFRRSDPRRLSRARWPTDGRTSRSRSAQRRQTTTNASALVREAIGPDRTLMIDANQRWDVDEAIARVQRARGVQPAGGLRSRRARTTCSATRRLRRRSHPIGVATGEHCANRVIFKQLLQAHAISFCQIDSCRLGGVNENLAVILMAAKFGVPVCPHAGGVGLCELVQHLSMFDYIAVSGTLDGRVTEFVDHLHEHFVDPVVIRVHVTCLQRRRAIRRRSKPNRATAIATLTVLSGASNARPVVT